MNGNQLSSPTNVALDREADQFAKLVATSTGAERAWAYRNYLLVKEGFYTSDELIDLAASIGFKLYDPFARIRRGTVIEKDVIVGDGTLIVGQNVAIAEGTFLDRAIILGNNATIGSNNIVSGEIQIDNLTTGQGNTINGISGFNRGTLRLGSKNYVINLKVGNAYDNAIIIGNNNELWSGLSINIPFRQGQIVIGHFNSLGRDGGGVISSSYRFGREWSGPTIIGNYVQMTRGSEVLGWSLLGWPLELLEKVSSRNEDELRHLFTYDDHNEGKNPTEWSNLAELRELFKVLVAYPLDALQDVANKNQPTSLFGTVKTKRCLLTGRVTVKDETKILCAYLRDVLIPERCTILNSSIAPTQSELCVKTQNCTLKGVFVDEDQDWNAFSGVAEIEYPKSDADFYQDWSWGIS